MEFFNIENWKNIWGLVIIVGLPLLFIFATRVYINRKPTGKGLVPPQIVRWLLIPSLALHLILTKILGYSNQETIIKVSLTFVVIILMSFLFNAINYLLFSKKNILTKKEIIPKLGRSVLHIFLMSIVSASVLSQVWGINLGNLLTALGVGSLVIGLALQEPLGNLFNGISLLMANPFRKGEWIDINGEVGKVVEISWRSVKIKTRFNEEVILPNNMLGKEKIKNLSRPNRIHVEFLKFGFSYDDNPVEVKAMLLELADNNERVMPSPAPTAVTISYDDYAITYGLMCFIKNFEDNIALKDEILTEVYVLSKQKGFTIPFPRQEVEVMMNEGNG
ncbi:mechanosensitive ion channel family protein [Saprospiraceae bacterium]|nr:mechanosensitive ion channel family protein [Saprospiraceae bacterium]